MSGKKYNVLILGASYGSLLATKLLLAGHNTTLICLPEEADLINKDGIHVRIPVRGRDELVQVDSVNSPGKLNAAGPGDVDPKDYDLVALAMQEPQYRSPGVRELLDKVATSGVPCMSIMNMPPLPYLLRLPGIQADAIKHCYTDPTVWENFDSDLMTLASPDPQAFRPPDEPVNVLQVSLPTNFKVARFASDAHTDMLRQIEQDIMDIRFDPGDGTPIELPVKLKVYESVFVPLAKWAMLMTGNYRCVMEDEARSIKEAVHSNLEASKEVYNWVHQLCQTMGADPADMVPFEKYANAAQGLSKPSSAARALFAGAPNIERLDLLVKTLSDGIGMHSKMVEDTVELVNKRLQTNRAAKG
ncbi:hypothetical protein L2D14_13675 [Thalassospiraceae bacterium LMO-JJ14]|nr:hypothetical protein L2D14_13675 [Thalassospiraceae bacterium LMO-JJ14]